MIGIQRESIGRREDEKIFFNEGTNLEEKRFAIRSQIDDGVAGRVSRVKMNAKVRRP
jgi:hypothetical protein